MSTFSFRPSARLQRYLGRELIADPNLALIEFVKNAYDADATNVYLSFSFPLSAPSSLVIADDGMGMDEVDFERNWMHPGYSEKAPDAPQPPPRPLGALSARVPVGEKGLGRLAAGRLGASLEVFTRRNPSESWLHVFFDWSEFDDMSKLMDEVQIAYDHSTEPPDAPVASGTILIIQDLEQNWDGRVRGRPVPGRSRTRLGRLKQDLRLLLRPLEATDTPFTIHLDSDSFLDPSDIGTITPTEAVDEADYIYDFDFGVDRRGRPLIRRRMRRSARLIAELGGQADTGMITTDLTAVAAEEARPATLECGPFRGRFLYTPPPAAERAKEIDAVGSGVLLYRDVVLVEPYGLDGNDWVGVSARKAQRQGYALVQPNVFSGYVLITRKSNPTLRDMSNREGLLLTEASEAFVQHVRAEFSHFERLIGPELQTRWESKEAKAAKLAVDAIDLAAVRLRAIGHSLGQPLLGLDADITALRLTAKRPSVPPDVRTRLLELADSASDHVRAARRAIARFRDVPVAERTTVAASTLVAEAVTAITPLAQSLGVKLEVRKIPREELLIHRELVVEAVAELLTNAIEAPRGAGRSPEVVVTHHHDEEGDFILDIKDNGTGMDGATPGSEFPTFESTKGRPGMGLSTVNEILTASLGRVTIANTGPVGTHIEVELPELVRGLRS